MLSPTAGNPIGTAEPELSVDSVEFSCAAAAAGKPADANAAKLFLPDLSLSNAPDNPVADPNKFPSDPPNALPATPASLPPIALPIPDDNADPSPPAAPESAPVTALPKAPDKADLAPPVNAPPIAPPTALVKALLTLLATDIPLVAAEEVLVTKLLISETPGIELIDFVAKLLIVDTAFCPPGKAFIPLATEVVICPPPIKLPAAPPIALPSAPPSLPPTALPTAAPKVFPRDPVVFPITPATALPSAPDTAPFSPLVRAPPRAPPRAPETALPKAPEIPPGLETAATVPACSSALAFAIAVRF